MINKEDVTIIEKEKIWKKLSKPIKLSDQLYQSPMPENFKNKKFYRYGEE